MTGIQAQFGPHNGGKIMRDITKYQGVIPAFYACYDEKGDISPEGVEALTRFLIQKGVKGVLRVLR